MKYLNLILFIFFISWFSCRSVNHVKSSLATAQSAALERPEYALVIHGGAGTIRKSEMSEEKYKSYYTALDSALIIGEQILAKGGSSIDAIEATINFMEDCPLFNSGRGAVFTNEGKNELDASIMVGDGRRAGAVGGVTNVKHPISAARAVMEKSDHVLLIQKGAEKFAKDQGLEIVDPVYFKTEDNWNRLQNILKDVKSTESNTIEAIDSKTKDAKSKGSKSQGAVFQNVDEKFGTVGAVALDEYGNIAAGTSTGGMTNKKWNRLGDSPIIGAGTFADNNFCGVSCTGHGEYFIRNAVAYDMVARMEYLKESVGEAGEHIIRTKLKNQDALGGLIALDKDGNITMPFNTEGMYRGWIKPGEKEILMYKDN